MKMSKHKVKAKRGLVFALSILAIVLVALFSSLFIQALIGSGELENGVKGISISTDSNRGEVLSIECGRDIPENAKYSVRVLSEGEKVYLGNRMVENDGTLGKYCVEVMFYDVRASEELAHMYPIGKVHSLKSATTNQETNFKVRIAYPPDDSMFVIYVGADKPILFEEQQFGGFKTVQKEIQIELHK